MSLIRKVKGLFVKNIELKKEVTNLLAVAINADSIVRPTEVREGYTMLENLFSGEDFDYLRAELDDLLEEFQSNPHSYLDAKDRAIDFVKANKKMRKDLISVVRVIFNSDSEYHRKEQELLEKFENEKKGNIEDEK